MSRVCPSKSCRCMRTHVREHACGPTCAARLAARAGERLAILLAAGGQLRERTADPSAPTPVRSGERPMLVDLDVSKTRHSFVAGSLGACAVTDILTAAGASSSLVESRSSLAYYYGFRESSHSPGSRAHTHALAHTYTHTHLHTHTHTAAHLLGSRISLSDHRRKTTGPALGTLSPDRHLLP